VVRQSCVARELPSRVAWTSAVTFRGIIRVVVSEELVKAEAHGPVQIQMFEPVGYGIAERIRSLNVDELRPIEALQLLSELQKELKRS